MAEAWTTDMTRVKSFHEEEKPDPLPFSSFLDGRSTAVGETSLTSICGDECCLDTYVRAPVRSRFLP